MRGQHRDGGAGISFGFVAGGRETRQSRYIDDIIERGWWW